MSNNLSLPTKKVNPNLNSSDFNNGKRLENNGACPMQSHGACPSQNLATGLQKCLATAWHADDPFADFEVIVDGVPYRCHKHLLSVTSGYFQAMFRSGMRESIENRLELKLISRDVFEVIGKALYTGVSGLTTDNIHDIWPATQLLQIQHLSDECENFTLQHVSENNCVEMFYFGKSISSSRVVNCANNFMIFGFEDMIRTEGFLELMTADVLSELLENQHLSVSSEDVAVDSIMRWAHYQQNREIMNFTPTFDERQENCTTISNSTSSLDVGNREIPNERLKHLPKLLRSTKLLLVSEECLQGLMRQTIQSPECLDIIREAMEYLGKHANQCSWKKSATHRFSSPLEHAVVIMSADQIKIYRMEYPHTVSHVSWVPHTPGLNYENMTVFKNQIFMEGTSTFYNALITLDEERNWNHVMFDDTSYEFDMNSNKQSKLFSHRGSLHRFNAGVLYRFCEFPGDTREPLWAEVFRSDDIRSATEIVSFGDFVLFFTNTEEDATVYLLDTKTSVFRRMPDFQGRAWCLVSFSVENITYILQSCGSLKRLVNIDTDITFELVAQLWDCEWMPMLAVTYLEKLVIFGKDLGVHLQVNAVVRAFPGLFDCIEIVKFDEGYQCFPMIVPRQWFN